MGRLDTGQRQRGSIMVLVMVIIVALLAGGAVALALQLGSTRQVGMASDSRGALYCAEGGLTNARPILMNNVGDWGAILDADGGNDPAWYPITGDIDGNGTDDYEVTLRDNDDEQSPSLNDPTMDVDFKVFATSQCIAYPETPRSVTEFLVYEGGGQLYCDQAGQGSWNTGNANCGN